MSMKVGDLNTCERACTCTSALAIAGITHRPATTRKPWRLVSATGHSVELTKRHNPVLPTADQAVQAQRPAPAGGVDQLRAQGKVRGGWIL
jgi:hypothetical protein